MAAEVYRGLITVCHGVPSGFGVIGILVGPVAFQYNVRPSSEAFVATFGPRAGSLVLFVATCLPPKRPPTCLPPKRPPSSVMTEMLGEMLRRGNLYSYGRPGDTNLRCVAMSE